MRLNEVVKYGRTAKELMIENNSVGNPPKRYRSNQKKKVCPNCNEEIYLVNLYAKLRPHYTITKWIIVGKWCPKCETFFSLDQIDNLPDNDRTEKLLREWNNIVNLLYEE